MFEDEAVCCGDFNEAFWITIWLLHHIGVLTAPCLVDTTYLVENTFPSLTANTSMKPIDPFDRLNG